MLQGGPAAQQPAAGWLASREGEPSSMAGQSVAATVGSASAAWCSAAAAQAARATAGRKGGRKARTVAGLANTTQPSP